MPDLASASGDRLYGLHNFIVESNRIEGVFGEPTDDCKRAHMTLLTQAEVHVADMEDFVLTVAHQPLRDRVGLDVRVGGHLPPPGGRHIRSALNSLLISIHNGELDPYEAHQEYEHLHPFMDGNGRSGRALWAWQMLRDGLDPFRLPFLHRWYYDSLDHDPARGTK